LRGAQEQSQRRHDPGEGPRGAARQGQRIDRGPGGQFRGVWARLHQGAVGAAAVSGGVRPQELRRAAAGDTATAAGTTQTELTDQSMIPKSGYRFSEKIMLQQ